MEKKYNIVLGLMIFFFLIIVGVALAWGLGYIGINKSTTTIDNNTSSLSENNISVNEENANATGTKENEQTVKETIKEVAVAKMLEFDYTKSKNIEDNQNYNGAISKVYYDGQKELTLLIYSDGSAKISVILDDMPIEYPINNLKGKAKDGMIGNYAQGSAAAYLLLEEGTVQSISDFSMFKQVGFTAGEVIEGVKDIVRLETIVNAGGKRLPIAIDKDGYYYSLR